MNKKNQIQIHLKNVLGEWIHDFNNLDGNIVNAAIENGQATEYMEEKLYKNCYISGGSIVSLLLGEEVNDYDVYFSDVDVCQYVVKKYCDLFTKLNSLEETPKVTVAKYNVENYGNAGAVSISMEADLKDHVKKISKQAYKTMYGNKINTIPLNNPFTADVCPYAKVIPIAITSNSITLNNKIQLVFFMCGKPKFVHQAFDFFHCMNYYNHGEGLVLNTKATESILTKELKYNISLFPIATLFRIEKFLKRGWNINRSELVKFSWDMSNMKLDDKEIIEKQLYNYFPEFSNDLEKYDTISRKEFFQEVDRHIL